LPASNFYSLPEEGRILVIYTHFVVREDAQLLYGFLDARDRALFRILIKVNGVGPKLGLSILSNITTRDFVQSVQTQDLARLTKLPGIGKKMAERLAIELKGRLEDWFLEEPNNNPNNIESTGNSGVLQDAIRALVSLGYKQYIASQVINKIKDQAKTSEELIRLALQNIGKVSGD
jgi:Holliday junction DNA helicase RuvA